MKVGILGGGQLGRMLALAGRPLGMTFRFLEPADNPPVTGLGEVIQADYADTDALERFIDDLDIVTYEFENVPVEAAWWLAERIPVDPSPEALELAQDRLAERNGLQKLGVPVADFRAVHRVNDLAIAVEELGLPYVAKTRRMGYDGKGQAVVRDASEVDDAWQALNQSPSIAESFIAFERELSIVGVRKRDGECRFYPLVQNEHVGGILRKTTAPAPDLAPGLTERAHEIFRAVAESTRYCGVLAIELFEVIDPASGEPILLVNELAPRVHNSGHWTQDGAVTSQFENHLRAIARLPLGSTDVVGSGTVMTNLIGEMDPLSDLLSQPDARVHLYEKAPRPGRKIGHINVVDHANRADR